MLFMQTNVLSAIPECFDLQAPIERIRPRDGPKETRPPRTSESVKKKPPNEPYVKSGVQPTLGDSLIREEKKKSRENKEEQIKRKSDCDKNGTKSESRGLSSDDVIHEQPSSSNGGNNYTYQKMRSKIKFKTKTKVRKKRSNSAPTLRRSARVEEEVTNLTEFRRLETRISFSSYVKRKTPIFSFGKTNSKPKFNVLRRTEAMNDIKLCGISGIDRDIEDKSDKNVIFNPIYEDEEPDELTSSTENISTSSEPDDHVIDKNDDDIPNPPVKRPPLLRCDHVEEEDELETIGVSDFEIAISLLNHDDTIDSDHDIFRQPIITFDTTHIRRDLYIIDEEPENEILCDH